MRTGYLLDNADELAADRWCALGDLYDEATHRQLTHIGVGPGWTCLEAGAGGGSIARWLAHRVAPTGTVTATDLDLRWMDHLVAPNLDLVQHDLTRDPLPDEAYDLVHARLVLGHVADPDACVRRLVVTLRPGGWLLLEEYDLRFVPDACPWPRTEAERRANRVREAFADLLRARGSDLHLGHRLVGVLQDLGLEELTVEGAFRVGPAARLLERANVLQTWNGLLGSGLTAEDLTAHLAALDDLPLTVPALVSVAARKPV